MTVLELRQQQAGFADEAARKVAKWESRAMGYAVAAAITRDRILAEKYEQLAVDAGAIAGHLRRNLDDLRNGAGLAASA